MAVVQTTTAVTVDNSIPNLTATTSQRTFASGVVLANLEQFRHSTVPEITHHRIRELAKLLEKYMLVWVLLVPYVLVMRLSHATPYPRTARSPSIPKWRRRNAGSGETAHASVVVEDPTPNAPREQFASDRIIIREQPKKEHFKGKERKADDDDDGDDDDVDGAFKEELKEEEPKREESLINLCTLLCDEPHAVASVDGDSMGGSTWTVLSETSESQSSERDEPTAVAPRCSTPSGCTFNDLPLYVQRRIFGYLDYSAAELWNLRRVCRAWRTQVHTLTSDVLEGAFIRSSATAHLLLTLHHSETATPQRLRHRLRLAAISHDGRAVFKVASADRRTTLMQGVRFVDVSMRVSTASTSSSTDNRMRVEIPVGRIAMHTGIFDACSHYVSLDCVTCAEPWSQMLSVNRIKLGMPLILRRMGVRVVAGRTSASTKKRT